MAKPVPHRATDLGPEKRCVGCGEWWPVTTDYFNRSSATADGFDNRCRACRAAYRRSRGSRCVECGGQTSSPSARRCLACQHAYLREVLRG